MPRVTRRRTLDASPAEVWRVVSDPHALPRWWPRTSRVESVDETKAGRRSRWTKVLETSRGRGIRADYRCTSAAENERYVWEQELEGTPFEKHLRESTTEIGLRPAYGGTEVAITLRQTLRGLSRLGSPMMRGAAKRMLDDALDGLAQSLGEDGTR